MLTLLAAAILGPAVADTDRVPKPIPPIQVTLNNGGNFAPGGLVNVRVETADDGYLIVFRVDGDGRVRVLFPLDPDADAFVRGGKEYELRGRGDRSTFLADDRGGSGMIYAALAHQSFAIRDFSANGHWNYDALRLPDGTTDPENDLSAIVGRMTNRARFDYDAIGYRVQDIAQVGAVAGVAGVGGYYPGFYDPYYNPRWRCLSCGWGYPGADLDLGFGYSPFWDPWLYSPWGYTYGYGFGYGFTGDNWWYGRNTYNPVIVVGGGRPIPQVPPGTRSRPRAEPPATVINVNGPTRTNDPGRNRPANSPPPPAPPPSTTGRSAPPSVNPGTRARPRPNDIAVTTTQPVPTTGSPAQAATPSVRPVFRQPQTDQMPQAQTQPRQEQPQPQSRPVYREPPRQASPPPPPPPQQSAPRSAPASAPAPQVHTAPPPASTTSRPRGGGR